MTLDLGPNVDRSVIGSALDYQLIVSALGYQLALLLPTLMPSPTYLTSISLSLSLQGLDTPTPYLKVGNRIFRGTPGALIGDELILKDVRGEYHLQSNTPHPSYPINLMESCPCRPNQPNQALS